MTAGSAPEFERVNLSAIPLDPVVAHAGQGTIRATTVVTGAQLAGGCNFIDVAELPPGTTIGAHRHTPAQEEFYLILAGRGLMRREDRTFEVGPGDLIRNPPGGLHGLSNTSDDVLRLFVFELSVGGDG
ncbi:cupin domain-containing protein [Kribbella albertanoniae]|uniref:Cupin domain-containing protein n=1 Tax=Kribbella albertanoniae TaxID=1266829 RepID=A0A4R4QJG8_9ACTN|nr:cupin domain-containing protein [Kribbella albertanoniae]TDC35509.1 cupin domain-containing protein [Kribbella albertanoniae]